MHSNKVSVLFGPPGTGKTTDLLNTVELLLEDGFPPESIAFIAFTRKAANEAKTRAMEKFKMASDRFPWFRTIHSLAFAQLGLNRDQIMGIGDYIALCKSLGLFITTKGLSEDGTLQGLSRGDRLFFMENMARARKMPLLCYWEQFPNEDIYWYELERLQGSLLAYKQENGKQDFTDIVMNYVSNGRVPDVKVMLVDEAQDLSPLQWDVVNKIGEVVDEVFIAGDDDQAIFRWAGADVDHLIDLPGSRKVLDQSYRVPAKIQAIANVIAGRISKRIDKVWFPRPVPGQVTYATDVRHIDMSAGTWLLLARNMFLLQQFNDHCLMEGFVFDSALGSPVKGPSFKAIRLWEELRKGRKIRADEARSVYDKMTTKVGVAYGFKKKLDALADNEMVGMVELRESYGLTTDKIWHEALDKLEPVEVEYFIAALKRGEKLLREPRIKISTIHSVKGGEAENVVICPDMADRTWREYHGNPDDEHRVWYVGVTRAKEHLYILSPQTNKCYDI